MARSLPLSAYLALRGADDPKRVQQDYPAPPDGAIIWAVCDTPQMQHKAALLKQALVADGDQITMVCTTVNPAQDSIAMPKGRREVKRFLSHWKPSLVLFLGDFLDPLVIHQVHEARVPLVLAEASQAVAKATDRNWIPGLTRAVLGLFDMIFATDQIAASALEQAGATPDQIKSVGQIEASPPILPYNEGERRDFAETVGTRPVWLAAATSLREIDMLARAHHQASRRSHRLLMLVALRDPAEWQDVTEALQSKNFDVAVRMQDQDVSDATQIYVVDGKDDLGLWYRASPVTYLGETLNGQPQRHPFEAATLGTALVYGPNTAPYDTEIKSLVAAGGCMAVRTADGLGDAIELLLSADKVAQMAHAAWDVTTRGADTMQKMAALIQVHIDASGRT